MLSFLRAYLTLYKFRGNLVTQKHYIQAYGWTYLGKSSFRSSIFSSFTYLSISFEYQSLMWGLLLSSIFLTTFNQPMNWFGNKRMIETHMWLEVTICILTHPLPSTIFRGDNGGAIAGTTYAPSTAQAMQRLPQRLANDVKGGGSGRHPRFLSSPSLP